MKILWSLIAALLLPLAVQAQYLDRPIRLIVPFAPGGVTDTSGRVVAEALSKRLAATSRTFPTRAAGRR